MGTEGTASNRRKHSTYIHWAKVRPHVRYDLATSAVVDCPASSLPLNLADLEINAPGGYGYAPLIQALASRFRMDPQCIVHANGTSMANHLAMAAVVSHGDEVLVEAPTYEPLLAVAAYFGGNVKRFQRNPSDGFAVDVREIERSISSRTRLIALTNLHNPTNALVDNETLSRIGELARSVGARVLVDEVYLETLFEPRPGTALQLGNEFIATGSLTKAYGLSGLRCGWVFAEADLAEQMRRLNDIYGVIPPHIVERLSVIALENLEAIAGRAKALLETNRKIFDAFVDSCPHIESRRPEFGTVVFPRLQSGDVDALWKLATGKYETTFVPGRFFEMPDHFRIGIGCESEVLSEGLKRLASALDEFAGTSRGNIDNV